MGEAAQKHDEPAQEWFDTRQAAAFTGKSIASLHKAIERGRLVPDGLASKEGHQSHYFRRATLDAFMAGGRRGRQG